MTGLEVGDRIEFLGFGQPDPYTKLKPGELGTVDYIDDAGTIHVDWDDGSHLGLVTRPFAGETWLGFTPDRFRKVPA